MRRLTGLDVVRGAAIMGMLVVHSTLFQYSRITELDFSDPPLIVTIIGFLAMWSGLFALVSGAVNAYSSQYRKRPVRGLVLTGAIMLILGFVYFVYIGPALIDVDEGNHIYSLMTGIMEDGTLHPSSMERVIYNSSLTMIGANLVAIALLSTVIGRMKGRTAPEFLLGVISISVLLISVIRIPLYEMFRDAFDSGNMPLAVLLSPVVNKNDPLLPYLGFGTMGMLIGSWLRDGDLLRRRLRYSYLIGATFIMVGIAGIFLLPDTMLERDLDYTWYSIMLFLFGAFVLFLSAGISVFDLASDSRRRTRKERTLVIRRFGALALSIFLIETFLADLFALVWDVFVPGWSTDMGLTVTFGLFMLVVWVIVLWAWEKVDYKYSAEWLIARWSRCMGKSTDKDRFRDILFGPPGKL